MKILLAIGSEKQEQLYKAVLKNKKIIKDLKIEVFTLDELNLQFPEITPCDNIFDDCKKRLEAVEGLLKEAQLKNNYIIITQSNCFNDTNDRLLKLIPINGREFTTDDLEDGMNVRLCHMFVSKINGDIITKCKKINGNIHLCIGRVNNYNNIFQEKNTNYISRYPCNRIESQLFEDFIEFVLLKRCILDLKDIPMTNKYIDDKNIIRNLLTYLVDIGKCSKTIGNYILNNKDILDRTYITGTGIFGSDSDTIIDKYNYPYNISSLDRIPKINISDNIFGNKLKNRKFEFIIEKSKSKNNALNWLIYETDLPIPLDFSYSSFNKEDDVDIIKNNIINIVNGDVLLTEKEDENDNNIITEKLTLSKRFRLMLKLIKYSLLSKEINVSIDGDKLYYIK